MNSNLDLAVLTAILAEVANMAEESDPIKRSIIAEHIYQMAEENVPF